MNSKRQWLVVLLLVGIAVLPGFGCASKSEGSKAAAPTPKITPPPPMAPTPPPLPVTPPPSPVATTTPVYVPDMSHAGQPMPEGVLAWDALMKSVEAAPDQAQAHFTFNLTNISQEKVAIVNVHPSCGCTTAQLPPLPWVLAPGTNGQINLTVNLAGKSGTLFKTVNITTDKGTKMLTLQIKILPPVVPILTEADRMRGIEMAKADRQAVFKDECATCHLKPGEGKYGQALYSSVCGVCHESEHRASMVPNLHELKVPTNDQFWRIWISHGKPGSLMPAFSTTDGGPLSDLQIASLAAYLNVAMPSRVPPQTE